MDIESLREFCLTLPHSSEDIKWGEHLCLLVGGKIFCITDLERETGAAFKVSPEDFAELTDREGITQAGHMAKGQWVEVHSFSGLSDSEWREYLRRSHGLVRAKLPKRFH